MGEFIDLRDVKHEEIEIKISSDGKSIWINTEERCIVRIQKIKSISLNDERTGD